MPRKIKEYNRLPTDVRQEVKELNDLSGADWAAKTKSVLEFKGPIAEKRRVHGAAYPLTLAKHFIELCTRPGDNVLDPFAGVGTTGDACVALGRNFTGFEINPKFIELARQGLEEVDLRVSRALETGLGTTTYIQSSCASVLDHVARDSIDFILTSPPYANLLNRVASHFANYTYEKNIYKGKGRTLTGWNPRCHGVCAECADYNHGKCGADFRAAAARRWVSMTFESTLLSVIRGRATSLIEALNEFDDLPDAKTNVATWTAELERFNSYLAPARLGFAYRVRDEILIYLLEEQRQRVTSGQSTSGDWWWGAFDEQVVQRILTRIAGDAEEIQPVLEPLLLLAIPSLTSSHLSTLEEDGKIEKKLTDDARYPMTAEKLLGLYRQITNLQRPSTSFWMA